MPALDIGGVLWMAGLLAGAVVAFFVVQILYLAFVFAWEEAATRGLGYYGRTPQQRARFKRALKRHGIALLPILRLLGKTSRFRFANASFVHDGVAGPKGTCSADSFARGAAYQPGPQDVFVATQMKCGTTWMQHVVYEVLHRGNGDLVETGRALYAVSPWLEGRKSVSVEAAPLLGRERPSRLIKTHFPTRLCPFSAAARYIYVVRHPVACFASCVDFLRTNLGAFMPPLDAVESWFRAPEQMWWGTWPAHVQGWHQWSDRPNVLFVRFEDLKADLPRQVERVAALLGVAPLSAAELDNVVRKCGFAYMQAHAEAFEMHPPHVLQADAELFVSGRADRHADVPGDARARILAWCRAELAQGPLPLERLYPDAAAPAPART